MAASRELFGRTTMAETEIGNELVGANAIAITIAIHAVQMAEVETMSFMGFDVSKQSRKDCRRNEGKCDARLLPTKSGFRKN
jgi:hypothetical protein